MISLPYEEALDRVRASIDIVDIIQRHVVLKKAGRNYLGKCPFHNDKNPSMNVNPQRRMFKCFSCGAGGDAFKFLERIENRDFFEVLKDLAAEQGIEIISKGQNAEAVAEKRDAKQKILDLNLAASAWFRERLQDADAEPVRAYLTGRYPDPALRAQALARFEIGYAPAGWENLTPHLKSKFDFVQANPDLLVTAGLSGTREHGQGHYDRFRHRLIIPIHDERGQVVAFGGRALSDEDKPKYLNSPETVVYHKSNVLYGFHQAKDAIRERRAAVVMEGYFDVMSAHLAGITEAVGSCGTAMTDSHLKLLTRFGAETVYLAFDSDDAGLKAAISAIQLIEPYMANGPGAAELQLKVLIVPDGKDPDEYLRVSGGTAFRALMDQAQHFLDFKFDMAIRGIDWRNSEGRIQAANRLTPLLSAIQRPTVRAEYLRLYAERIGLSEEALALEVKRYEQSQAQVLRPNWTDPKNFQKKKAISKPGSTSFKSKQQPILTDNLSELRAPLLSRHAAAEKTILQLALYNSESFVTMMRLVESLDPVQLSNSSYQEILGGLRAQLPRFRQSAPEHGQAADAAFGTLLEEMNHLYFNQPDVLHTFAELVLTAESLGESFGLGELSGSQLREKVSQIGRQHVDELARCQGLRRLRDLRTHALQGDNEEVELTYQFQDHYAQLRQSTAHAAGMSAIIQTAGADGTEQISNSQEQ